MEVYCFTCHGTGRAVISGQNRKKGYYPTTSSGYMPESVVVLALRVVCPRCKGAGKVRTESGSSR